ncbi:MAG: hypothetical protein B7Z12_12135, partial [Caulobacter vibrioides]
MMLQLYVLKTVATRILGAALILMSVLQILDLLDVTSDILDRGLGMAGVAYYAALRLPRLFEQVAPIAVLAGGLFAFSQLARESAVVAMRASGISGYRIVAMAVPAVVAVMLVDALCDLSSRDALTGLANRRQFDLALERETDRVARSGEAALVLLLDIDHFKRVNDT